MEPPANLRLRLAFEDGAILSKSQKKEGLKLSWVLLKPHLRTISDVVAYLLHSFDLHDSCPNGIVLSMDGFVLPPFESTAIFKDKDLICVKRKGTKLRDDMKAIEGLETLIEDKIIEKQPLPSNIMLLANEEYNKETGGYESESEDDGDVADENILPVENAPRGDVVSKKRKASSKVESSETKAKKRRHITPESVQKKHVHQCEQIRTPEKKRKHKSESKKDAISHPEVSVKDTKILEPTSVSKKSVEPEENREKIKQVSAEPNETKKISRTTRRKRLKRLWQREQRAKAEMEKHQCEEQPVKEKPVKDPKTDSGSKVDADTKIIEYQQADENSDADDDLVPVIIRPGHIRFTPSAKANDVQENPEVNGWGGNATENGVREGHSAKKNAWGGRNNKETKETFQWNGITNKRRGQKWGMEKQSTSSWNESRDYDAPSSLPQHNDTSSHEGKLQEPIHRNGIANKWNGPKWGDENQPTSSCIKSRDDNTRSSAKQLPSDSAVDFEKLAPLTDSPKAGDIIAYRLVELSSSWCPELSSFRVGKISRFQPESNRIMLVPDPEYPLNHEKKMDDDHNDDDDDDDDDAAQPPDFSVYNEDGSLEIDFPSLVDVRVVKRGDPNQSELPETPLANGISVPSATSDRVCEAQSGSKNVVSKSGNGELIAPAPVGGQKDAWEEISEALSAKKTKLMQENGWNKEENPDKRPWSRRGSALGPIMERLRAQNAI